MTTRCSGVSSGRRSTSGRPMLPPRIDRVGRIGRKERGRQRRGRGLALRARNPDAGTWAHSEDQVRLADQGRRAQGIGSVRVHDCPQGRPQARLGRGEIGVDAWRSREQISFGPCGRRIDLRAKAQSNGSTTKRFDRPSKLAGRPAVVDRDASPGIGEEAGKSDAAPSQSQDRDRSTIQGALANAGRRQPIEVDDPPRHCYLGGMEATKSVTPNIAASAPTIQKRIVIFSSSQPPSSKWWCSGAIRKTRLPRSL